MLTFWEPLLLRKDGGEKTRFNQVATISASRFTKSVKYKYVSDYFIPG